MDSIKDIEIWSRYHALGLMLALVTYLNIEKLWILPAVSLVSMGYLILVKRKLLMNDDFKMSRANMVTLGRHDLLLVIVVISSQISLFFVGVLTAVVAILDILDGYFARIDKNASLIGEYLDKEVDAVFVLMLCVMIYHYDLMPIWILGIGVLRYIYVLILPLLKSSKKKEYKSNYGKIIAIVLMVGLIGCFIIRHEYYLIVMKGVAILVFSSFLNSILYWIKNRLHSHD